MLKIMPHKYNCSHLCAVTDVLADEWTGTAIETSVGVVVMNVRATVAIDALTGGTVGDGIDMLVCAETMVVAAGVIPLEVITLAGDVTCKGDSIDPRADVLVDM